MVKLIIFTINRKNSTFKLLGTNVTNSTINYQTKDGAIIVNISGIKREYYKSGS